MPRASARSPMRIAPEGEVGQRVQQPHPGGVGEHGEPLGVALGVRLVRPGAVRALVDGCRGHGRQDTLPSSISIDTVRLHRRPSMKQTNWRTAMQHPVVIIGAGPDRARGRRARRRARPGRRRPRGRARRRGGRRRSGRTCGSSPPGPSWSTPPPGACSTRPAAGPPRTTAATPPAASGATPYLRRWPSCSTPPRRRACGTTPASSGSAARAATCWSTPGARPTPFAVHVQDRDGHRAPAGARRGGRLRHLDRAPTRSAPTATPPSASASTPTHHLRHPRPRRPGRGRAVRRQARRGRRHAAPRPRACSSAWPRLARRDAATRVSWLLRRPSVGDAFGGGDNDQLEQRGRLGQEARAAAGGGVVTDVTRFRTEAVAATAGRAPHLGPSTGSR